mgnify:CR=1 FL=1
MSRFENRRDSVCMSPLDAARLTAEDFDQGAGVQAMAQRLGKAYQTFRKELSPPEGSTAKLGLLDAVRMMTRSGDFRIADAIEAELGRFALPLPLLPDHVPDDHLAGHLVQVTKEAADVLQEAVGRAADGDISDADVAAVEEQWGQLMAAGSAMMKYLVARNRAGKAATVRRRPAGGQT